MVPLGERRETAVEQPVGDAYERDALPGVGEDLGGREQEQVVVCVAGHGAHERRFVGVAQVVAAVHGEVGEVFHHDDVVPGGQFADDGQLLLFERDPGRVVGVAVHDGRHVAVFQLLFQLGPECLAAVGEDVELLPLDAEYPEL